MMAFGLMTAPGLTALAGSPENPAIPQFAAAAGGPASATPSGNAAPALDPAVYHHVAQVTWVVGDIVQVVGYWQRLGMTDVRRDGEVGFPGLKYRGEPDPASAMQATGHVGKLEIRWIQPLRGGRFWRDGLRERGDGIRVLSYLVRSPRQFDEQVEYFASRGVGIVVEQDWEGPKGPGRMAYLDNAAQGGGTAIGLIDDPEARSPQAASMAAANEYPFNGINHFGWVVDDVKKVDAYYTSLGFRPFSSIDHNISLDRVYRGQPGSFEMWLGWNRTGDAPFEWIQQITGPDVYLEYAKKHGEGLHHVGVVVTDVDAAIALMTARGAPPSQAAAWRTQNGKGHAIYLDTEPFGGVTLELIGDTR